MSLFSNIITTVSKKISKIISKLVNNKIIYIPNGVDLNLLQKEIKIEEKDYLLFSAARIIPVKGCHILLKALNILNHCCPIKKCKSLVSY